MTQPMRYHWHLRQLMATRGMFQTTDLVPLLADRGITLSREQVFRLVTGTPQRLSLDTLAALCDILDCQVGDLIEVLPAAQARKTGTGATSKARTAPPVRRTTIKRPGS